MCRSVHFSFVVLVVASHVVLAACDKGPAPATVIKETHFSEIERILDRNVQKHAAGLEKIAEDLGPRFSEPVTKARNAAIRKYLRTADQAPKGVRPLWGSPLTFIAALDEKGTAILRDVKPSQDRMRTKSFAHFEPVKSALSGKADHGLVVFEEKGQKDEPNWLFTQPITWVAHEGKNAPPSSDEAAAETDGKGAAEASQSVSGALMLGIPLWRLSQQFSKQLQLDHRKEVDKGIALWVYLLVAGKDPQLIHFGTPPELDVKLPDAKAIDALIKQNKEHTFRFYGNDGALLTMPLTKVGAGLHAVVVRVGR